MRPVEATKRRVSFADLQRMPDDGNRYELYDGELRVVPAPSPMHQLVLRRLYDIFHEYMKVEGGDVFFAPLDIVLSEHDVIEPDLMYFTASSCARLRPREPIRFAPDLAIEVLLPSTKRIDRGPKSDLLARHHLPEYWLVDPDACSLEVRLEQDGRYPDSILITSGRCQSRTLPGLAVEIEPLFVWPRPI